MGIWAGKVGPVLVLGLVSLGPPALAQAPSSAGAVLGANCALLAQQIQQAWQNPQALQALDHSPQMLSCPSERQIVHRRLAALAWNQALVLRQNQASRADFEAALRQVLAVYPLWQAYAALGDLAYEQDRNFTEAVHYYQQALYTIDQEGMTPTEPTQDRIEWLYQRLEEVTLLSTERVEPVRDRSQRVVGLGSPQIRSYVPVRTALPIHFRFDSVEFTERGHQAAEDLLDLLQGHPSPVITLRGHTDPVGSRAYNLRLSENRAQAVAEFLRQRGYTGDIRVEGRGPDEPFEPSNPALLTREELHQLHRRVELIRH